MNQPQQKSLPPVACLASVLTLLALPAAAVQVAKVWGPLLPKDGGLFVEAVPRDDGSALAATGNAVSEVDPQGGVRPLGGGDLAVLNPDGASYALRRQSDLQIFDLTGPQLGTRPGIRPYEFFKLIPGGKLLYAPRVEPREETGRITRVRILAPDQKPVGDFAAPGLEISRFGPDRIVYTQPKVLIARRLDGSPLWKAAVDVHKLETAADRTILVPRYVKGRVLHYLQGKRVSAQAVEGVVWNLAIAPSGRFSAATTRTILYIFRDGRLLKAVPLRLAYANSLAVSDRGEALVGGQTIRGATTGAAPAAGPAQILLYDAQGRLLWKEEVGIDRNGYRPAVRFAPGGDRFVVIEKRGLSAWRIERSRP